jgi:hypothetical protein
MWVQIHKWEGDEEKCALEKKKRKSWTQTNEKCRLLILKETKDGRNIDTKQYKLKWNLYGETLEL